MFGDFWRTNVPKSSDFDWFQQVLDEMFPSAASDIRSVPRGAFPMINMGRTDDAILVYVFAPGLKAEQLELSVQDNVLTLSGTREPAAAENGRPQRAYYRRERFGGEFSRTIALPDGVDTERAEARAAHGVVEIRLPKREEMKPRRVEIKAA
ncbi:HSP20 family protein [Modicisalibacter ilicicola DSM 19980]|uniref:HSP20 family protein n=1 Tax=Modicisalibacter ilicicola DSM 19980 TaxID=1121942 RepID=A0A1M5BDI5_9GAMM|nr:Hsp20/alpha crystallin family protein [Halomonas ilicicola]SHF40603.1 HSP20 family protein [Halomonas ilicicola DSM 19980]